ncbi:hypothetical protein ACO0LM_23020 [Undibacterium sp. Di26W]|uniref:hypothetical protein n=1 Tax=Undibacterium sp. Di26W TaxID=3413035 RepID=UPI003BF2E5A9
MTRITEAKPITRQQVNELEAAMKKLPQVELKVVNHFANGVYARELHIPVGVTLTGRIHKYDNLNILSQGEMLVTTEAGLVHVKAPFTVVSPAGTKRIATTLTDCIWTSIHGTDETDIDKIEQHFTAGDDQEYLDHCKKLTLEGTQYGMGRNSRDSGI